MFQLNSTVVGVANFFRPETTKMFIQNETSFWLNIWHAETASVSQRLAAKLVIKYTTSLGATSNYYVQYSVGQDGRSLLMAE